MSHPKFHEAMAWDSWAFKKDYSGNPNNKDLKTTLDN